MQLYIDEERMYIFISNELLFVNHKLINHFNITS